MMPPTSETRTTVELRGGVVVSLDALNVLWDLEARGFAFVVDGERLRVTPGSRLTSDDTAAIRQHRDELLLLVRYCEGIQ